MSPKDASVDAENIGYQTQLSQGDIKTLSKSYSCAGRVATYGGGNAQVRSLLLLYSSFLHLESSSKYFHFFTSGFLASNGKTSIVHYRTLSFLPFVKKKRKLAFFVISRAKSISNLFASLQFC
jgi:hypothetical protein